MARPNSSRLSIAPSMMSTQDEPPPSYHEAINQEAYHEATDRLHDLSFSHAAPDHTRLRRQDRPVSQTSHVTITSRHRTSIDTIAPHHVPPARSSVNAVPIRKPIPPSPSRLSLKAHRGALPTADQCLTHLKLLECFHRLREEIGRADGLFGIRNELIPCDLEPHKRTEVLARACEKRWQVYVTRACMRYQSYWRTLQPGSQMLGKEGLEDRAYQKLASHSAPIIIGADELPPLDILMVHHAFMLNPRNFFSDCVRFGKTGVWAAGMPWQAVSSAMSGRFSEYLPGDRARDTFQRRTKHPWNNLDEPATMKLKCPRCDSMIEVLWTTADGKRTWSSEDPGEDGAGFADKNFCYVCTCGLKTTHEVLRTQRFKNDVRALVYHSIPMHGTFLTKGGLPATISKNAPGSEGYPMTFPNRLMKSGLAKNIAMVCSVKGAEQATMRDVASHINSALSDEKMMRRALRMQKDTRSPTPIERLAIKRMLSKYWDNSSLFSMDLVGAVIRQNSFTDKMHDIDWLHSPTSETTLRRLIFKYESYLSIMARYPLQVVVPTLDIDLAWHTHQLNPPSYVAYTLEKTGSFVNHDDKIDENALSTAFEWTSKTYQEMFGKLYSECLCWYCEAIREPYAASQSAAKKFSRRFINSKISPDPLAAAYAEEHGCDPTRMGPHISTHNAIKSTPEIDIDLSLKALVLTSRLERAYEKACYKAEKEGRPLPKRTEETMYWGHKLQLEEGAKPGGVDACLAPGLFVSNPACQSGKPACIADGGSSLVSEIGTGVGGLCVAPSLDSGKGIAVGACGACSAGVCGGSGFGGCGGGSGAACGSGGGCGGSAGNGGGPGQVFATGANLLFNVLQSG